MVDSMDKRTSSASLLPKGYGSECALAISNNYQTLELVRSLLATDHINLITSRASQRALELIRREEPSLVLLDMSCSGLDLAALTAMTADENSCTALVLLADEKNHDRAIQCVEEGAYDFIEQPLEPRTFHLLARRALHHANSLRFKRDYKRVRNETVEVNNVDLLERKDFFNGILNSSNLVSVVLTDLEQYIRFWNRGAENIFGYTAGEMIGTKVTRLYPQDLQTAETVEQLQSQVKSKADNIHGKMKQVAKDGRILTISLAVSPLLDGSGNVQGIVGIGQDVTEETRLHDELVKSFQMLKQTQDVSIFALARLAESRDEETGLHLTRIQHYCRVLCRGLAGRDIYRDGMIPGFVEDLVRSSVLHDIGKVTIPDSILLHPGKFTPEQFAVMREHPIHGGQALDDAVKRLGAESFLSIGRDVAYYHHEHWDGKGYPFGLEGEAIPLSARIVAAADVYDALTTERRYKRAFTHEEACSIIQEGKSKQFDPEIVDAFLEVESEFRRIRNELSTNPDSCGAAGPSDASAAQ
jgi:PAS domain S-box-containing protein